MSGLTDEQRAAFHARLEAYGLKPSDALKRIDTGTALGPTVLHGDPDKTDEPAIGYIRAASIRELKDKLGVPDDLIDSGKVSDAHIDYPPELSENLAALFDAAEDGCELERRMCAELPDDNYNLMKARLAYVHGHSKKVASYEPVINAVSFPQPLEVPVHSAESVVVKAGHPLVLKSDGNKLSIYEFGSVTVEAGGEIQVIGGSIQWTSQTFTQE